MKRLFAIHDQPMDLPGGNLNPPLAQLLGDQRFGDLRMVVLVQHPAYQRGPKVASLHRNRSRRHGGRQDAAIRRAPFLQLVAGGPRLDHQLLHNEVRVALEAASGGNIRRWDLHRFVNHAFGCAVTALALVLSALALVALVLLAFQRRRTNLRLTLVLLQARHFLFEHIHLLDEAVIVLSQRSDQLQQTLD